MENDTVTVPFGEIKDFYRRCIAGDESLPKGAVSGARCYRNLKESYNGHDFYSISAATMAGYLSDGFRAEDSDVVFATTPTAPRRKLRFWEEGEYDYDLDESGFDYPYLEWEKREGKLAIEVQIIWGMLADTPAEVLSDYGKWCAQLVQALENQGFAVGITFKSVGINRMETGPYGAGTGKQLTILIPVSQPGEPVDYAEWSALFSPGGYRHLAFSAYGLAADRMGERVNDGMGSSTRKPWAVEFNEEERVLTVMSPNSAQSFSEGKETLDEQLAAITELL